MSSPDFACWRKERHMSLPRKLELELELARPFGRWAYISPRELPNARRIFEIMVTFFYRSRQTDPLFLGVEDILVFLTVELESAVSFFALIH